MPKVEELVTAVDADEHEAVRRLVEADPALLQARGDDGVSVLLRAVYRRRHRALEAMLAAGPALDLFEAAALGRLEAVEAILAAEPPLATARSADGFTALHLAAFFDHPRVARLLLERGADPGAVAQNPMRVTPLHSAAAVHGLEVVELLLARGVDVDAAQAGGFTALHAAAHSGDLALVELLLAHGADRERHTDDGRTALDFAREAGSREIAERLRRP